MILLHFNPTDYLFTPDSFHSVVPRREGFLN